MAPNLKVNAVAFISPQNHPILIRTFDENTIKYHYIAHTSLDVIEERGQTCQSLRLLLTLGFFAPVNAGAKLGNECYLVRLYLSVQSFCPYNFPGPLAFD